MANNPYTPPTAEVTDAIVSTEPLGARPRTVIIGIGILAVLSAYSLLGLTRFDFAARFEAMREQSPWLVFFVFLPMSLVLVQIVALTFAFLRRKWARIMLAVLFAWTLFSVIASIITFFNLRRWPFSTFAEAYLLTWALLVVRGIALGLLFSPAANAWFRARAVR